METGSGWIKGPAVYQPPRQASPNANSLEAFCGRAEAALLQRPALITPVCFRQTHAVIASAAKQSSAATGSGDALDCFVAPLLAMTLLIFAATALQIAEQVIPEGADAKQIGKAS